MADCDWVTDAELIRRIGVPEGGAHMSDEMTCEAKEDTRTCTCHPDDAPIPCPRKFAAHHCWRAAVYDETRAGIVKLKNLDRNPAEQLWLNYLMRVERALDGTY